MFDNYLNTPKTISVNVHKAPTDDSIRLYGELLARARSEVLETLAVENELICFNAIKVQEDLTEKIYVAFKLNGKSIMAKCPITYASLTMHKHELMAWVAEIVAGEITKQLLSGYVL